jgi:hypothetical protein
MRYSFVAFFVMLICCLAASKSHGETNAAPVVARASFQSVLITNVSSYPLPKYGRWQIGLTPKGDYLDLAFHELPEDGWPVSVWNIVSVDNWKTRPGWFVFIESESKVWAYDGDQLLILVVETPTQKGTFSRHFPFAVPTQVLSRLSESARKEVEKH